MNGLNWIKSATMAVSFGGALLCLCYAFCLRHSAPGQQRRLQLFYGSQTLFLLLFGVNKQLGLLNWLTSYSRLIAVREGWYDTRRLAQFDLIVGLGVAALVGLLLASWYLRAILRQHWLPLLIGIGLLTYVAMRTVSYHAVDALILDRVLGVLWDWLIELVGICLLVCTLTLAFHWQQRTA